MLVFKVSRKHLEKNFRLGKVHFTDCTDRTRFPFKSNHSRFHVDHDGTLKVKIPTTMHEQQDFIVHTWDTQRHKFSVHVRVVHQRHHHGNHTKMQSITMDTTTHTTTMTLSRTLLRTRRVPPMHRYPYWCFPGLLMG
ncbi:cadherin-1-like [Centropristis striata]|uniref:cadherin-1-like n=1 Tax=Centropristis striata TaxID=184440 RepID=UPI0027E0B0D7|nr:cadherin-1-like [Centropristis striata]